MQDINIVGAREHNLKNVNVHIPRYSLTVITGLSGSGKSSLAFDTIYAEGQRRYIDTFSAYARGFLGGGMTRPNVEEITGLAPVISIDQKTTNRNPRSTVGTVTEIYDFFRLLYARAGQPISFLSKKPMRRFSDKEIFDLLMKNFYGRRVLFLAPLVVGRKGHYKELFIKLQKKGYVNVRVDGVMQELVWGMQLERFQQHNIEVQTDKLKVSEEQTERVSQAIQLTLKEGKGMMMVVDIDSGDTAYYSRTLMCSDTGIAYREPAPHNFSFNSPNGYCPECFGFGRKEQLDIDKLIPDKTRALSKGAILPFKNIKSLGITYSCIKALFEAYHRSLDESVEALPQELLEKVVFGAEEILEVKKGSGLQLIRYDGLKSALERVSLGELNPEAYLSDFYSYAECPSCQGKRLNQEALHFLIDGKDIGEVASMELTVLSEWLEGLEERLSESQRKIAGEILKEIRKRLSFLIDVGLEYLSLNRVTSSLSGGESQRIRLATQIGTQLVEVLYILDEPSIGLHQRDNERLIGSLVKLRDLGNTIIVVEHDEDMMLQADYIIDIGPKAGKYGGEVVFQGSAKDMLKSHTMTAQFLNGFASIPIPQERRQGNGFFIKMVGARGNNLKHIDVSFPLGTLIGVVGVSGSGKSTLINQTLYPAISQKLYKSLQDPLDIDDIQGLEHLDKVIAVDQSPIGRTPRSNPATYIGVFTDIRNLFVALPESKMRGYKAGRYSFNVPGGRCVKCNGNGNETIEMNFLPDVYVPCLECQGKRYNRETLEIRYKGKSIADVLDMTVNEALLFFDAIPAIKRKVQCLQDVGLGYVKLGQSSTTLSGGESQRIKLASELSKKATGKSLYILDEPTTGLHFEDIRVLLEILNEIVDRGNTIIVIEHNLDVIKSMDYLIEIGPNGGANGGELIFEGSPEDLVKCDRSVTAKYLDKVLNK